MEMGCLELHGEKIVSLWRFWASLPVTAEPSRPRAGCKCQLDPIVPWLQNREKSLNDQYVNSVGGLWALDSTLARAGRCVASAMRAPAREHLKPRLLRLGGP